MAGTKNTVVMSFSIAMFLLLILLLVITYNSKCQMDNAEKFNDIDLEEARRSQAASQGWTTASHKYDSASGRRWTEYSDADQYSVKPQAPLSMRTNGIKESDPLGNESYGVADSGNTNMFMGTQVAGSCVSRDRLTSADLLPIDANSKWAELNPQCAGDLQDQNYLTAGYHIGINTVGQSLRNANLQLRYEPPNPQLPVSPWMISTIEPDASGLKDIGHSGP
jgi:hypothetical protein